MNEPRKRQAEENIPFLKHNSDDAADCLVALYIVENAELFPQEN